MRTDSPAQIFYLHNNTVTRRGLGGRVYGIDILSRAFEEAGVTGLVRRIPTWFGKNEIRFYV